MYRKKILLILILMIFTGKIDAIKIEIQDQFVLDKFFKTLFSESEGGYVLFQKKPICINGCYLEDLDKLGTSFHIHSVIYREGLRSLSKIPNYGNTKYIIHAYEVPDSLVTNCTHFLVIDKEGVIKTVNENLSLFRYILGPALTPKVLLEELISPNRPFHTTIKNDKVLIGILLGFGVENSLAVSREENIFDMTFDNESPPNRPLIERMDLATERQKELMLLSSSNETDKSEITKGPSLGFNNIKKEARFLSSQLTISSEKLAQTPAPMIFGRLKENTSNIEDLEKTQEKIRDLLKSEPFLEKVLLEFTGNNLLLETGSYEDFYLPITQMETKNLPIIIAKLILQLLQSEENSYVTSFYRGMLEANNDLNPKILPKSRSFLKKRILFTIKEKIDLANKKFLALSSNAEYSELISEKLYARILKNGTGKELVKQTKIKARYLILMGEDEKILKDHFTTGLAGDIDLTETITGFAYGMKGMKCGEVREIYIHPSIGYGIYTTLPKGEYLKTIVELVDITEDSRNKFPSLQILDLKLPIDFDANYRSELDSEGYIKGYEVWSHFKPQDYYTLHQVMSSIGNMQGDLKLTENEAILINKLQWNLYKKTGKI